MYDGTNITNIIRTSMETSQDLSLNTILFKILRMPLFTEIMSPLWNTYDNIFCRKVIFYRTYLYHLLNHHTNAPH